MEVFHEPESHHTGSSDGDIAITSKITIYLECEEEGCKQHTRAGVLWNIVEYGIYVFCKHIGHTKFHEKAP